MIIVPEMIGSTVAVYNGKIFNVVDVKAEMVGYYLGEFSITYRCVFTLLMVSHIENKIRMWHNFYNAHMSEEHVFLQTVVQSAICMFTVILSWLPTFTRSFFPYAPKFLLR